MRLRRLRLRDRTCRNTVHNVPGKNSDGLGMSDQEKAEIRLEFARLKQEHADFDAAINAMMAMGCDPLQVQRMKKKKLALKDRLLKLEDRIIPDIIA
jgi:hypothetical protein